MPYKNPEKQKEAKRRYEEKRKNTRFKVWTLIFYPDSAPEYWPEMLSELHMPIWVSPLHDSDVWTQNDEKKNPEHKAGQKKKAHYHLVVEYENPIDLESVRSDFSCLNGASQIKNVRNKISMLRYLIHADDPKKAQYKIDDVQVFGNAAVDEITMLGSEQRHAELKKIRRYIVENGVVDFFEFCLYCDEYEDTWSRLLDDNSAYVVEKFIKSYRAHVMQQNRESNGK